jgi:hypothetical protein
MATTRTHTRHTAPATSRRTVWLAFSCLLGLAGVLTVADPALAGPGRSYAAVSGHPPDHARVDRRPPAAPHDLTPGVPTALLTAAEPSDPASASPSASPSVTPPATPDPTASSGPPSGSPTASATPDPSACPDCPDPSAPPTPAPTSASASRAGHAGPARSAARMTRPAPAAPAPTDPPVAGGAGRAMPVPLQQPELARAAFGSTGSDLRTVRPGPRSLTYTGLGVLALSVAGMIMIGLRRRSW